MNNWEFEILKEDKDGCVVQTMDGEVHFLTWKTLQLYNNKFVKKDSQQTTEKTDKNETT
jgi:hypothetical protein